MTTSVTRKPGETRVPVFVRRMAGPLTILFVVLLAVLISRTVRAGPAAFGEISLLTGEPRTATVRAVTETVVVEIDKTTPEPIIRENPALCGLLQEVIEQRRRATADLFDATRAELDRAPERTPLADPIAHFFGLA